MTAWTRAAATLVAAAFIAMTAVPPAAALTDAEAEKLYTDYHRSIRIYELCKKVDLSDAEIGALGNEINERIEHKIGAKRLKLLTAAQRDAKQMHKDLGCDHYDVRYYVRLFLQDLKPVLE